MIHDVIIIGSGPAGLTAGMYLGRFKHKPLIIDGDLPGGQLMKTGAVENWPGEQSIQGPALVQQLHEHAEKSGSTFLADTVTAVDFSKQPFSLTTKNHGTLQANSVIIATGSSPKRLGAAGEDDYWGKGVNICAVCDAPLYQDKEVVVVGGGNGGVESAYALGRYAKKVTMIQILDKLTATDPLVDTVLATPHISVIYNKRVIEIKGNGDRVGAVVLEDQKDKSISEITTDGVFISIGMIPKAQLFKGQIDINEWGYLVATKGRHTNIPGIFVAGDVEDYKYRQAITASGDGCAAALEVDKYLRAQTKV